MLEASSVTLERPLSSVAPRVRKPVQLRATRPSILDLRFCGDPWIVAGDDGQFALCLGDYSLASINSLPLDLPALNGLLDRVRHRRPRYRLSQSRKIT